MKVFIADINIIAASPDEYAKLLSPRHCARALKYVNQRRKLQFILGRLMAKSSGKKYTSIAACDDLVVVAAASNAPVGIDIANVNMECDASTINTNMQLPEPTNHKEVLRNLTFANAAYRAGKWVHCRQFMRHGDYIICVTSVRRFAMPRLNKFNPDTLLTDK